MTVTIGRRELLAALGGAAAAWPLAARAQQAGKPPTIGFLGQTTLSGGSEWVAAFVQRLHELGWNEGRTIAIEYRWAEGREERFAEIAAEIVRLRVDVIVTSGTPQVLAVKQATSVIPIVFATAADPVATGLVASLARPGGNVTGLSVQHSDLAGKRLELLREVVPGLRRVAIIGNFGNPAIMLDLSEVQAAARTLGLEVATLDIRHAQDIVPAFEALKGRSEALYVCTDGLINTNRIRINILAVGARLPTMHGSRDLCGGGRADVPRSKLPGSVSARRRLCRQDSAWDEAGQHPRRTADQVRSRHQLDHRQGTRPCDPGDILGARR